MQTGAATKENSMEVPAKINIELPYDLVIPILGIYSKKHKTLIRENTFTPMVIAALFTTAKIWKQPVSINRQLNKERVIYIWPSNNTILLGHERE